MVVCFIKMQTALYLRASRKDQTLEQQESILKDYCIREGLVIYKVYAERGVSGAKESRPQLDLMLQDMRQRKFNTVAVLKFDRLGRSTKHLLQTLDEMKNKNVRLIATAQNIDTSTPMGKFFFTILAAIAELEREFVIERTSDKLDYYKQQIAQQGFFINKKGEKCFALGRRKGSKDKAYRKKGGYYLRYSNNTPPTFTPSLPVENSKTN
jgi:DNA invertase Pin-like site-specific DNA recombinase